MSESTLPLPNVTSLPGNQGVLTGVEPPRAVQAQFTPAPESSPEPQTVPSGFTADDLAKARQQEKDKLYPQIEQLREQLSVLQKEREERVAAEEALRKQAEAEAAEKAKAEMTLKERLKQVENEMEEKFLRLQEERERERALLDQERKFHSLSEYRNRRVDEERDNILPELLDLIAGNTEDEIEQSIAGLRERSARILDGARQAISQVGPPQGARVTAPPAGPLDTDSENRLPTPDEIRAMDINEYAKHRERLLNGGQRNRGLFSGF